MSRRITREKALQTLFQMDVADADKTLAMDFALEHEGSTVDRPYFQRLIEGILKHKSKIDSIIKTYSIGWELDRMAAVDRNVLRLATYELLFETDIPENVVLNEAIEIAKTFSTQESGKFVNGILGKMIQDRDSLRSKLSGADENDGKTSEVE
ncbi:transcription antitermination factor NusB [Fodinisporobacter ferrooxydans]|uniref:Transcription antitermination protein NusB n=1 Tax=Fodinisporobacter ferrooxydans TaxID=2901836 RepID=A0ABY4CJC0_9BACL|nr:transcription antitermination factor NusB [Alicyclobacillaceae bacterium MYW30-H2]